MAKSDRQGNFRIRFLPVGRHQFRIWHERAGYLRDVVTTLGTADYRGRLTVDIKPGENMLGEIRLPPARFLPD